MSKTNPIGFIKIHRKILTLAQNCQFLLLVLPAKSRGFNMSINSKKFIFFKELQGDHYKYVNLRYFCETSEYYLEINKHYGCPYEPKILCLKTREQHYLYNITNDLRKKNHPKTLKEAKERIFERLEKNKKVDLV
jgi:hypothetical protein